MSITSNLPVVIGLLQGMVARMRAPQPALQAIGDAQASRVLLRLMQDKRDPEAAAWDPWAPSTREQREKRGTVPYGLLWDSGTLLATIAVQAKAGGVSIGTNSPYAPYLQDGTDKMPARPFLGWADGDESVAELMMARYIEGAAA